MQTKPFPNKFFKMCFLLFWKLRYVISKSELYFKDIFVDSIEHNSIIFVDSIEHNPINFYACNLSF
jgi:hypothetical protein